MRSCSCGETHEIGKLDSVAEARALLLVLPSRPRHQAAAADPADVEMADGDVRARDEPHAVCAAVPDREVLVDDVRDVLVRDDCMIPVQPTMRASQAEKERSTESQDQMPLNARGHERALEGAVDRGRVA